jgi:hypothetical protein
VGSAPRAMGVLAALAGLILAAPGARVAAADLDDLPPEVREKTQPVHINWSKQLNRTLEGGLHLKGVQLPGGPDGAAGTLIEGVHLQGVEAPAQFPVEEVGASALSDAAQSLLVGLLAQGTTSAEDWREQIETSGLTVADLCAVWRRFRREHPRAGERFGVASSLWAAIGVSIPAEGRKPADLGLEDALSLGEIQLWGCDGEAAQQTFEALVARLPEGPTTGRVSRGLLAYRIAQCRQQASDLEGALDWFLKCAEWGAPEMTGGYDVRGEGLVEAARLCRRLGRDDEAQALYEQAINECGGWGRCVAVFDRGNRLIKQRKFDQAIAVLKRLAEGVSGPMAAAYAYYFSGCAYWGKGSKDLCADCMTRALDMIGALRDRRSLDQVAPIAEEAKATLALIVQAE